MRLLPEQQSHQQVRLVALPPAVSLLFDDIMLQPHKMALPTDGQPFLQQTLRLLPAPQRQQSYAQCHQCTAQQQQQQAAAMPHAADAQHYFR